MAKYIKKVGVTPTRGNGFIIDSFNTGDDKRFNAPSIAAVEKRLSTTDSNILFNSDFTDTTRLGFGYGNNGFPVGWERDGDRPLTNLTNNGLLWSLNSLTGSNSVITSPSILPDWLNNSSNYVDFNSYFPITVSIKYYTWVDGGNPGAISTASATFITKNSVRNILVNSFGDGASFYVELLSNGKLKFGLTANNPTTRFALMAVKAEYGANATPFVSTIKDAVIAEQIENLKSYFIVEKKTFSVGGTPPAGNVGNVIFDVTKTGYKAIGILGIQGTLGPRLCISEYYITQSSDLTTDRVFISYYKALGDSASFTINVDVLYMKV